MSDESQKSDERRLEIGKEIVIITLCCINCTLEGKERSNTVRLYVAWICGWFRLWKATDF